MRDTTHDLQTVLDAIRGEGAWNKSGKITTSAGNVTIVARRLGVHPNTVRNYAKRWNSVAAALEEEQETLIDMAENKLAEKVVEGDNTMIIFLLKAHPKAKARGWSERSQHEVSGKDGDPLEVVFRYINANAND